MSTIGLRLEHTPVSRRQSKEHAAQGTTESSNLSPRPLPPSTCPLTTNSIPLGQTFDSGYLQISPYTELEHQLELDTLDTPSRLFAQALTRLESVNSEYAMTEYSRAFNWPTIFTSLRSLSESDLFHFPQSTFYVVEFRSKLREHVDNDLLFALDKQSHRKATASGGLLKYWYGNPDVVRRTLATFK